MQNKKWNKRKILGLNAWMLALALVVCSLGCGGKTGGEEPSQATVESSQDLVTESSQETVSESSSEFESESAQEPEAECTVLGEGTTEIFFTVVALDGSETRFEIHTDKETVGDALLEHDLIAGDESEYGLYVKTVNGITADYDKDKTYWAFYVNGEYAMTGVDSTMITAGDSYMFKVEQ